LGLKLTLIMPGVLSLSAQRPLWSPSLSLLGARGRWTHDADTDYETAIFDLFGVPAGTARELAVAPVSYLGDTGQAPPGYCLRADPVHLHARRHQLILMTGEEFYPSGDEAQHLVNEIQLLYADRDWQFEAPHPSRWYLHLVDVPRLQTWTLAQVLGKDIDAYLPTGDDGVWWHGVLNEIQMVLHQSQVNFDREQNDAPTINSVWFWGGGNSVPTTKRVWDTVWADEVVARGLALAAGTRVQSPPDSIEIILEQLTSGRGLIVLGDTGPGLRSKTASDWERTIEHLDYHWLLPLIDRLKTDRTTELVLYDPGYAQIQIDGSDINKWWRRKKPPPHRLNND
jgi:hypothetical protein